MNRKLYKFIPLSLLKFCFASVCNLFVFRLQYPSSWACAKRSKPPTVAQTFAIGIVNVNWGEQISDGGNTYPRKSVPRGGTHLEGNTFTGTPALFSCSFVKYHFKKLKWKARRDILITNITQNHGIWEYYRLNNITGRSELSVLCILRKRH